MNLTKLFREQPVGLPFAADNVFCSLYTFHDLDNTIMLEQRLPDDANSLIAFVYTHGVWKQQFKHEIEKGAILWLPLSPSQMLVLNSSWQVTAYNHTLNKPKRTRSSKNTPMVFDVDKDAPNFCRLNANRFIMNLDDMLELFHVDEDNGFTRLSNIRLPDVNGLYSCDGATFMYSAYSSLQEIAGVVNVSGDSMSFDVNKKFKTLESFGHIVSLTSTSFVVTTCNTQTNKCYMFYYNTSDGNQQTICEFNGVVLGFRVCKLSATSILVYDKSYTIFQYLFGKWQKSPIHDTFQHQLLPSLIGLNMDNSFASLSRGVDNYEFVAWRQKSDMTVSLSDAFYTQRQVRYISQPSIDNHVCFVMSPGAHANNITGWTVVDLNTGVIEHLYRPITRVKIIHVVHPYIIFIIEVTGGKTDARWFNYKTDEEKGRMHVDVYFIIELEQCLCIIYENTVRIFWPDDGTFTTSILKKPCRTGFSNNKFSFVLCDVDKHLMYFDVSKEMGLQLKAEHNIGFYTSITMRHMQWDYVPGCLNFFFSNYSASYVHHAALLFDGSFAIKTLVDIDNNAFLLKEKILQVGNEYKLIKKNHCVIDHQRVLSLEESSRGNNTQFLQLTEYCMWSECATAACSRKTNVYGTRCESCESNVALKDSKCEVLNAMPSCVPRLDEFAQKEDMLVTTIPAGTLLFHSTKATCSKHQDPAKPVYKVFYEEGQAPKSTGLVYFCVNPWISLTTHFYFRRENAWNGDGDYSKLVGSNKELAILKNAVNNGRPGALCVYKLTQDIRLINTTSKNRTRSKLRFCKDANLMCKGDDRPYQNNDFGIVCWAVNHGMDGMLSIDMGDPIDHAVEEDALAFQKPIRTDVATKPGAGEQEDEIPFIKINGTPYTWEIVITDFESKLELVTWIDACKTLNSEIRPKKPVELYKEVKEQLQNNPDTNIWKPVGLMVELKIKGSSQKQYVFVNVNAVSNKLWLKDDAMMESTLTTAIHWFVKDILGPFEKYDVQGDANWYTHVFTQTHWYLQNYRDPLPFLLIRALHDPRIELEKTARAATLMKKFDRFKLSSGPVQAP